MAFPAFIGKVLKGAKETGAKTGELASKNATEKSTKKFNPDKRLNGNVKGPIDVQPRFNPEKRIKLKIDTNQEEGEVSVDTKTFNPDKRLKSNIKEGSVDKKPSYNPDKRLNSNIREDSIDKNPSHNLDKLRNSDIERIQNKFIEEAEQKLGLSKLDSQARGNYAEMKVDRDLAKKGYERLSKECVTDLKTNTGPGIDGVFRDSKTGNILITETKFNKSELGKTLDGKQMSSNWIDKRLDSAVGKEMADKIRMDSILAPDSVKSVLAKVNLDKNVSYFKLDSAANITGGIAL